MLKWLLVVLAVLTLLLGGGGYVVATSEQGAAMLKGLTPAEKATEVRIDPVPRGELVRTVTAPGEVEPRTKVSISAQVAARIVALPFREGEEVKEGDVVVRLESRDLAAAVESAHAALRSEQARVEGAQASLARAEADLRRQRELHSSRDVSQSALDVAEAEYLQAQASLRMAEQAVEIARANIQRAEKDLDNAVITSPIDGTITRLDAEVGELVMVGTLNNAASVIMEIADLSRMLLKARVDESNIAPVRAGQRARVHVNAYTDRVFEGTVERIQLQRRLDRDQTGYFETEILLRLDDGERLYSGLTANCEIEVETFYDVLRVPSQAVLDRRIDELPAGVVDGNPLVDRNKVFARVVYVVKEVRAEDGSAALRTVATPVSIGSSDQTHTVVLAGVSEGDRIVTGPYRVLQELKHDQRIAEMGAAAKAAGADGAGPEGAPAADGGEGQG